MAVNRLHPGRIRLLEKIMELLLALTVGAAGLTVAADRVPAEPTDADENGIGWTIAAEHAAHQAAIGLSRAGEARAAAADREEGHEVGGEPAVDGRARAAEAVSEAMTRAPEEAQPGLTRAFEAITTAPAANEAAAADASSVTPVGAPPVTTPVGPPASTPPVAAPPVEGQPTTVPPVAAPPVEVPVGPPADAPGGRP